jgi:iron complex transport system substrate-binding protein
MRRVCAYVLIIASFFFTPDIAGSQTPQIEVKDMAGRMVTAPVNPQRIVCLGPGTLRQIVYLGQQSKVVGIENFEKNSPYGRPYLLANPQLCELPTIAPGGPGAINNDPDLEATLKVKPDVIFVSYMEPTKATTLQEKIGIPVVVLSQGRFAGFDEKLHDSLLLAAQILQAEERANAVIKFINDSKMDLEKRAGDVSAKPGPTVYVGGVGFRGQQGIESTDSDYTPFEWVKANNVVKNLNKKEHLFINKEQLLAWNPDMIFIDGSGLMPAMQDYQKNPDYYNSLKAVKDSRVFILFPFNFYVVNVDTAIADAYAVGKLLYPESFADIDITSNANRIYKFFVNKPVYEFMEKDFGALTGNGGFTKK